MELQGRSLLLTLLVSVIGLAIIPVATESYIILSLFTTAFIYCCLAQSWNLIAGYTGQFSLASAAFFGIGGYTVALLTIHYRLSPIFGIPIGAAFSALLAASVGGLLLRLREDFFAIGTIGLSEVIRILLANREAAGGQTGIIIPFLHSDAIIYYVSMIWAFGIILGMYAISKSSYGMALIAVREDEEAAASVGVPSFYCRFSSFVLSAFFGGVAGGAYAFQRSFVQANSLLGLQWTILPIVFCVIGGLGTIFWPIVMSFVYVFGFEGYLAEFPVINMLSYALALIIAILVIPSGISSLSISKLKNVSRRLSRVLGRGEGRAVAGS